jgi:pimeloyl-ACP methyl ester carboxylesterase
MNIETFSPRRDAVIAYQKTVGTSKTLPGVMFLGGFRSDMTGTKAAFLEEQCKARNQSYVRFDYTGHGASNGTFEQGNISTWLADATEVLDQLTEGPQILVGSSMGGWIALLLALQRKERLAGLIGLAPAPDFSEDIYNKEFREEERRHLAKTGLIYRDSQYGEPYPLTLQLFQDAKRHLLLDKPIAINCPVRLIHGKKDPDVPWQKSLQIKDKLTSPDATVIFIDDGDHRLSKPEDLALIDKTVVELSHLHQLRSSAA